MLGNQSEDVPSVLFYRLLLTYLEAPQHLLPTVNKQAYYRLSVWQEDEEIAEMYEGITPVLLADKIFLSQAYVNFSHETKSPELSIVVREHYSQKDRDFGKAALKLEHIIYNYLHLRQRFFSLQEATLVTEKGNMRIVYNIFVESSKYQLDVYIRKFKENEREVMRAKRNINTRKKEILNKSAEAAKKKALKNQLSEIEEESGYSKDGEVKKEKEKKKVTEMESIPEFKGKFQTGYLEIESAAKFHRKEAENNINKIKSALNEIEQKEFQAYSSMMESYENSRMFSSDLGHSASIISDGSEESEMFLHNHKQTYSEKAVKRFKQNINRCVNVIMVIVAVVLIAFVLMPSRRYTKPDRLAKKFSKIADELTDI